MDAMTHLGRVLTILADLHRDDRCRALDEAMAFYNRNNPHARVEPADGYETRLVNIGPLHYAVAAHRLRKGEHDAT